MRPRIGRHAAKLVIEVLVEALESKDRQHEMACEELSREMVKKALPPNPNELTLQLLPVIQQRSGERGTGETAHATLLRIIEERDALLTVLARHAGQTGVSEPSPVVVLNRIIEERDAACSKIAAAAAMDKAHRHPRAKASPRRRSV